MANRQLPVVPDTGTAKAARLAAEHTDNPGRWVRLDCRHTRHVQQPVAEGQLLECPTCPPSPGGVLARRRVVHQSPSGHRVARLAADPQAPSKAGQVAVEAVAGAAPEALLGDVERVATMPVADAIGQTHAPVELTVDTHDDVVRVEVRNQGPAVPPSVGSIVGHGTVLWCELRDRHASTGEARRQTESEPAGDRPSHKQDPRARDEEGRRR